MIFFFFLLSSRLQVALILSTREDRSIHKQKSEKIIDKNVACNLSPGLPCLLVFVNEDFVYFEVSRGWMEKDLHMGDTESFDVCGLID